MIGRRLLHFDILETAADPERRRRFVPEAKAASALNHPNIITVHDITQADGLDLIVMEHVDGKTLDALIPRSGMRQLWKLQAEGGTPVQTTRRGGVNAIESADGRTLYYARDINAPGFCRMPLGGGEEEQFLDIPERRRWGQVALTDDGLYYLGRDGADARPVRFAICFYEFATRKTTRIYQLAKPPDGTTRGLARSPDGRSFLFSQLDASGSDLMLLQNFR